MCCIEEGTRDIVGTFRRLQWLGAWGVVPLLHPLITPLVYGVCVLESCELQTDADVLKQLGYLINIKLKILINLCFLPMPFFSCWSKKELLELCISHWWRWCLQQAIYWLFVAESMFEASYNRNQPTFHVARQTAVCSMAEYENDKI